MAEEIRYHHTFNGTQAEVLAELEERAEAYKHIGSERKRERYLDAISGVRAGSFSVKVGNTIFNVDKSVNAPDVPEPRTTGDETADKPVS